MAVALEYLLVSRLKEETRIDGPTYLTWQALFPKGFTNVSSKASKSTNMGKKSPDKILCDFANEWADDVEKAEFVDVAREIGVLSRRSRGAGTTEAHRLMSALSERRDVGDRLAKAKGQLVKAVVESLSRDSVTITYESDDETVTEDIPCVLAPIIEEHYDDPWGCYDVGLADGESVEMRGLAFLFSNGFREAYITLLKREFGWKDDYYYAKFVAELESCQWAYMSGELSDEESRELMRSVIAMYVLAGLVGPGTFAEELGCSTSTKGTSRGDDLPFAKKKSNVRFQLQPIVFTGEGVWSYYTDSMGPITFTSDEIVRFGRMDNSDPHWLEEHKGISINNMNVSRKHAQLEHRGLEWFLTDLGSANGTIVLRGYGGGKIFRVAGYSEVERRIQVSTGDLFFFGPKGGYRYDTTARPLTTPKVETLVRGKAFRFELVEV
ncbi:MAG: FHA domain-containing protein [Coriobacteriales bacterium]|nr:FHA domain-containing protein [Coriobacteriales bacterium]